MTGRKHTHRRRRNKRRARRNNVEDTPADSRRDNTNNEPGHSCLSYAELMSSTNTDRDGERFAKLKAEIIHLKHHLISAHVDLVELTIQSYEFKRSVENYKQKMNVLNLFAFGSDSKTSEPDEEEEEGESENNDDKKKVPPEKTPTPSTSTCHCEKQDYDDDESDDDDDSETT